MPSANLQILVQIAQQSVQGITNLKQQISGLTSTIKDMGEVNTSHVSSEIRKVGEHAEKTEEGVTSLAEGFSKLGETIALAKEGLEGFLALEVVKTLQEMATEAAKGEALATGLRHIGENAGYSAAKMKETTEALLKLGLSVPAATKNLGDLVANGIPPDTAEKLARSARVLAVQTGKDVDQVFEQFSLAVMSGRVMMLRRMGVQIDQAAVTQAAVKANHGKSLTQEQLLAANADAVSNEVFRSRGTDTKGGTLAQIQDLGKAFDLLKEAVGGFLSGPYGSFLSGLKTGVEDLTSFLEAVKDTATESGLLGQVGETVSTVWDGVSGVFSELAHTIGDVLKAAIEAVVAPFKILGDAVAGSFGPGSPALTGTQLFINMLKVVEIAFTGLAGVAEVTIELIRGGVDILIAEVKEYGGILVEVFTGHWGEIQAATQRGVAGVEKEIKASQARLVAIAKDTAAKASNEAMSSYKASPEKAAQDSGEAARAQKSAADLQAEQAEAERIAKAGAEERYVIAKNLLDKFNALNAREQADLKQGYDEGTVSYQDYWNKRLAAAQKGADLEVAVAKAALGKAQAAASVAIEQAKSNPQLAKGIQAVEAEQASSVAAAQGVLTLARINSANKIAAIKRANYAADFDSEKKLKKYQEDVTAAQSGSLKNALAKNQQYYDEQLIIIKKMSPALQARSLKELDILKTLKDQKAVLKDQSDKIKEQAVNDQLRIATERAALANKVKSGALTDLENQAAENRLTTQEIASVEKQIAAEKALLKTYQDKSSKSAEDETVIQNEINSIQALSNKVTTLKTSYHDLGQTIQTNFTNSVTSTLDKLASGTTTLRDAMVGFLRSFLSSITSIIDKDLAQKFTRSLTHLTSGAANSNGSGIFGSLATLITGKKGEVTTPAPGDIPSLAKAGLGGGTPGSTVMNPIYSHITNLPGATAMDNLDSSAITGSSGAGSLGSDLGSLTGGGTPSDFLGSLGGLMGGGSSPSDGLLTDGLTSSVGLDAGGGGGGSSGMGAIAGLLGTMLSGSAGDGSPPPTSASSSTGSSLMSLIPMVATMFGFAQGGQISGPGTGTSDSIPIWASHGEYMINAEAAAKNRPLLDMINSGHMNKSGLKTAKFAAGGPIGKMSASQQAPQSGHAAAGGGTRVVNTVDPAFAKDYMQSADGEKVILNVIRRNNGQVRQLLG